MDNQYDSILKQKKTYDLPKEPKKKSKFKKYFIIDFILIIIVLIISYIYYYNHILSPQNIILNNNKIILKEYQEYFKYLNINNLLTDGTLEGTIKLNEYEYKFNISKKNDIISINLDNTKEKINYYYNNNGIYYQIPSINNSYIKINNKNKYQGLYNDNIINNINQKINSKKESKKLYLNENNPTVEMNMNITKEDIKSIVPNFFKDDYELIITTKNGALSNKIISEKIVINNQTKNIRTVYQYENGVITTINNSGKITKYEINKKENLLNIKHKDKLYSIIKYTKKDNKNIYTYQIIDDYYNITLSVTNQENHYIYEFTSNIGENNDKDNVIIEIDKSTSNNIDNIITKNDDETSDIETYKQKESEITKPLRDFIDKYKESINHINNY